jgi:hypothetical protein
LRILQRVIFKANIYLCSYLPPNFTYKYSGEATTAIGKAAEESEENRDGYSPGGRKDE